MTFLQELLLFSCWIMSDSLQHHGLQGPWNLGQNTEVGSSLLQGIFPTQGWNPGLPHCRQILYQVSHKGSKTTLEWVVYPFSSGSSQPGIELVSPALQVDSLPTELSEKPPTVKVIQSCTTLCNPMDYMVHGILQAKILEWVAIPFSKVSSQPKDQTQVSCIAGRFFTSWATRGSSRQEYWSGLSCPPPGGLPTQGLNLPPPHWEVKSEALDHQGSPDSLQYYNILFMRTLTLVE